MDEVSKRELEQNTAAVLKRVTEAEDIVVTERGEPRWRIIAFQDQNLPQEGPHRERRYTPPSTLQVSWPRQPGGPKYSVDEVVELLDSWRSAD